ncbi:MAG TPA: glycosyl hydrolase [Solirubrobacterales bacterium]|nr:glycosyl hydrolase [Solirubrobacterales bacterium]
MRQSASHLSFRARAFGATLLAAAGLLATGAASAEAVPAKFWGVVPQATPTFEHVQRLKRGGVDSMRIPIFWAAVQPVQGGVFEWSSVDPIVAKAAAAGVEVLPFLYGTPSWAVPPDPRVNSPSYLPVRTGAQKAGWKRFLRELVLRYGPNGSFWSENPGVPKRPIRVWQIWNEPNFKYFVARPNPAEYGKLVKLSYGAIRSVDRGAQILLGGMFAKPIEALRKRGVREAYFATEFLVEMYRTTPGIQRRYHGVALHPYTGTYQRMGLYIEELRTTLKALGDAGKSLWLTELGWSSQRGSSGNSLAKGSMRGQVKQLKGAFRLLEKNQRRWKLKRIYWFAVEDQEGSCNFCGGTGLFTEAFVPKPAWRAYVGFAGGRP